MRMISTEGREGADFDGLRGRPGPSQLEPAVFSHAVIGPITAVVPYAGRATPGVMAWPVSSPHSFAVEGSFTYFCMSRHFLQGSSLVSHLFLRLVKSGIGITE